MGGEGAGVWAEVQPPVPRYDSVRTKLSDAAWGSGIEAFFLHAVPFSYSTGKSFASRIARLIAFAVQRYSKSRPTGSQLHLYEFGAGLGVLALHILDLLREQYPDLYSRLVYHVTDCSELIMEQAERLGVLGGHQEHVRLDVLDALRPQFRRGEEPAVVIQSYMVSSLPVRHVEVSGSEVWELLVRTRIPRSACLLDASTFPPRVVEAESLVERIITGADGGLRLLLPQLERLLQEEHVRIPIRESGIPREERIELETFVATLHSDTTIRFNYCFAYARALHELLANLSRDTMVVVHDFGWVDRHSAPKAGALSTSYGATTCHGVSFPYLISAAEQEGAVCRCTANAAGESQVLMCYKGDTDDGLDALFVETFADTGYEAVRAALCRCTEIAETDEEYPESVAAIMSSLAEPDRHDYALQLGIAWELLRRGFLREAIDMAQQSLDGYRQVAVDSYLLLGLAHRKLGELDLAETHLRRALTICPHYYLAHAELGHVLLGQGRQEEHLEAVIESIRGYPDDGVWEQVISAVIGLLVQGRTREADSALTAILKTVEHHTTLLPDDIVRRLVALQKESCRWQELRMP